MKTQITLLVLILALSSTATPAAQEPDGAALFTDQCARCHTPPGVPRAPTLETMRARARGDRHGADNRHDGPPGPGALDPRSSRRREAPALPDPLGGPHWSGWGVNAENHR